MLDPAGRAGGARRPPASCATRGSPIVYVTQEMDEVVGADRVVALEAGTCGVRRAPCRACSATPALVREAGARAAGGRRAGARRSPRADEHVTPLPLTADELVAALEATADRERAGARHVAGVPRRRLQLPGGASAPIPALRDVSFELERRTVPGAARRVRVGQVDAAAGGRGAGRAGGRRGRCWTGPARAKPRTPACSGRSGWCSRRPSCSCSRRRRGRTWRSARAASAGPRTRSPPRWTKHSSWSTCRRTEFGDRHPYALSGGEQRRLALAGVLAMRPRLLLLDEPFVSLDPATRRELVAHPLAAPCRRRDPGAGHARRRPGLGALRRAAPARRRQRGRRRRLGPRRRRPRPARRRAAARAVSRRALAAPRPGPPEAPRTYAEAAEALA